MSIATSKSAILATLALTVAGCVGAAPPTRYYQLVPVIEARNEVASPTRLLGVSPVRFPDYLDRPQIVTRATNTRITVADFDQWSERLELMFSDVLLENLRREVGGEHVVAVPNDRNLEPSIEVDLIVLRFDVDAEGGIVLQTRWRLFDDRGQLLLTKRTDLTETATPGDYASVVDGMSRAVGALAEEIVATLPEAVEKAGPANGRRRSS